MRLEYTKWKKGMRAQDDESGRYGIIVDKHNGRKELLVLFEGADSSEWVPYEIMFRVEEDPLDQIHPMLAKDISSYKTLNVDDLLNDRNWGLEEKFDGERQILIFEPDATGRLYLERSFTRVVGKNTGRLGENQGKLQHLSNTKSAVFSGVCVVDVEILHPDGFNTTRKIMGSDDEKARERQAEWGYVEAIAFDMLWYDGRDLRNYDFVDRRYYLEKFYAKAGPRKMKLSEIFFEPHEKREKLDEILAAGGEGAMLKHRSGKYTDTSKTGRRSADLLKIKPFLADEVIITGFEWGVGEYNKDKFGKIRIAQYVEEADLPEDAKLQVGHDPHIPARTNGAVLVDLGACTGFTQAEEEMFRADPESFIGRAIEVKYQQRWPDTLLMRNPNFIRLRDDKSPEQCIYQA